MFSLYDTQFRLMMHDVVSMCRLVSTKRRPENEDLEILDGFSPALHNLRVGFHIRRLITNIADDRSITDGHY